MGVFTCTAGAAAEETVLRHYSEQGLHCIAQRWRGSGGELDIVFRDGAALRVVEVKSSRSWARAAVQLTPAQLRRITLTIHEFLDLMPRGALTDVQVDLALVDHYGAVQIRPSIHLEAA